MYVGLTPGISARALHQSSGPAPFRYYDFELEP